MVFNYYIKFAYGWQKHQILVGNRQSEKKLFFFIFVREVVVSNILFNNDQCSIEKKKLYSFEKRCWKGGGDIVLWKIRKCISLGFFLIFGEKESADVSTRCSTHKKKRNGRCDGCVVEQRSQNVCRRCPTVTFSTLTK